MEVQYGALENLSERVKEATDHEGFHLSHAEFRLKGSGTRNH